MIKHICVCDICGTEEFFYPGRQMFPQHWEEIKGLLESGDSAHVCPSCWNKIREYAKGLYNDKHMIGDLTPEVSEGAECLAKPSACSWCPFRGLCKTKEAEP